MWKVGKKKRPIQDQHHPNSSERKTQGEHRRHRARQQRERRRTRADPLEGNGEEARRHLCRLPTSPPPPVTLRDYSGNKKARGEEHREGGGGGGGYKGSIFRRQWHMKLFLFPREPARALSLPPISPARARAQPGSKKQRGRAFLERQERLDLQPEEQGC